MNIEDLTAKTADTVEAKKYFEKILKYPDICGLLMHYYNSILNLKPANIHQAIDEKKLTIIISLTISRIASQIALFNDNRLAALITDMLCAIRLLHITEFESNGAELNKKLIEITNDYCSLSSGVC